MNLKEFNHLSKIVKSTKCKLFVITPSSIIGTDEYFTTLTEINMCTNTNDIFTFTKEIWDNMLKDIDSSNKVDNLDFNKVMGRLYSIKDPCGNSPVIDLYNKVANSLSFSKLSVTIDDLKTDAEFVNLLNLKADIGMKLYRFNSKYMISIFSGLLPVNKSDRLALQIYDEINMDGSQTQFICKFIINKGPIIINKYIKFNLI